MSLKQNEVKRKSDHEMLEEMRHTVEHLLNVGAQEVNVEVRRYSYAPIGVEEAPCLSIEIKSEQRINSEYR